MAFAEPTVVDSAPGQGGGAGEGRAGHPRAGTGAGRVVGRRSMAGRGGAPGKPEAGRPKKDRGRGRRGPVQVVDLDGDPASPPSGLVRANALLNLWTGDLKARV